MDLRLEQKCALISGGSRGIGRSIALALAREGCRVAVTARGREGLGLMEQELYILEQLQPGEDRAHLAIEADMTTPDGTEHALEQAASAFGGLDIVVANVGKSGARHCDDMDDADFQFALDMNLWSAMRVCRGAVPHMRARGGGAMVLISSIWGKEAGGSPAYNVAKSAVISLAKAMARDYAADAIRVNTVAPGSILFPGGGWDRRQKADPEGMRAFVERELPFGRFGTPEEVADVVAFLCSPRASWISGACITVDGCQSIGF